MVQRWGCSALQRSAGFAAGLARADGISDQVCLCHTVHSNQLNCKATATSRIIAVTACLQDSQAYMIKLTIMKLYSPWFK